MYHDGIGYRKRRFMSETYLVRAKLEFNWDFEERDGTKYLKSPNRLPLDIGPFRLDNSPNAEYYLMDLGWIEPAPERKIRPNWDYPVSLLYVETTIEVKSGEHPESTADDILEQLEAMLRLFQGGDVYLRRHGYMWQLKEDAPELALFLRPREVKAEPTTVYDRGTYPLDDDTLKKFIDFFYNYWDIVHEKPQPLYNATFRFNSSYERRTLGDRLMDLVIALEALFGDRGRGDSLTYKIALRCSSFLYPPGEAREKTYRVIKKVYDDRSDIVHGEKIDSRYTSEEIDQLEAHVRRSITRFIEQHKKGYRITSGEDLDKLLFFTKE